MYNERNRRKPNKTNSNPTRLYNNIQYYDAHYIILTLFVYSRETQKDIIISCQRI